MKLESLKPGMVVYDVGRTKMGNTTITTVSVWMVRIVSVDAERRTVVASWNTNRERTCYEHQWKKWRLKKPVLVRSSFGRARLATREEQAAMKRDALKESAP